MGRYIDRHGTDMDTKAASWINKYLVQLWVMMSIT